LTFVDPAEQFDAGDHDYCCREPLETEHRTDAKFHTSVVLLYQVIQISWLRVSGTTKMPQIDHGVRHQFHTVMALLFELKAQQ
jgi:hypothetical protein